MGERIEFGVFSGKLRLKAVKRRSAPPTASRDLVANLRTRVVTQRLISHADAANCRDLREETRVILSTVTPQEEQVLRMRFGIGETPYCSVEEIARYYALECGRILEIEAQALRKLRRLDGRRLQSVSRR